MNDNFCTKVTPGKKKYEAVLEPACKTMSITFDTLGKIKEKVWDMINTKKNKC